MGRHVTFMDATRWAFEKYFDFSGRAQRAEYWWFFLFTLIASVILGIADAMIFGWSEDDIMPISTIFSLAVVIPSLSVGWRRMHDIDRSGWWTLLPYGVLIFVVIALVTLGVTETAGAATILGSIGLFVISFIYVIVLLCRDSDYDTNRFGPSPKYDERAFEDEWIDP